MDIKKITRMRLNIETVKYYKLLEMFEDWEKEGEQNTVEKLETFLKNTLEDNKTHELLMLIGETELRIVLVFRV